MKREIRTGNHRIEPLPVPSNLGSGTVPALAEWARTYGLPWLLAHADDGVLWGELRADGLHLSSNAFDKISPPLRAVTLQQARLFGPSAELLLWKDGTGWQARLIQDGAGESGEYYDETHLLWGSEVEQYQDGFALLRQGREGLRHAPPLPQGAQPLARLRVRHYVAHDADGQAYIAYSRLVSIEYQGGEE
jgi:CRISPR-associated protein (TIGR03984 family)